MDDGAGTACSLRKRYQRSIALGVRGARGRVSSRGPTSRSVSDPAEADTGVVFVRTDLPDRPAVAAHIRHVVPRQRRTTLQDGAASVEMVEHVLAALAGLHIDNCTVEIDAPETPGCDGRARRSSRG
jgi:UDP-3-O-acyl-N-acetylglucosamine deacetylase